MKSIAALIASSILLTTLMGCAGGNGSSGRKGTDLSRVRIGTNRGEIELDLGRPLSSVVFQDGRRRSVYKFTARIESSGERRDRLAIIYGKDDKVVNIERLTPLPEKEFAPPPGWEEQRAAD